MYYILYIQIYKKRLGDSIMATDRRGRKLPKGIRLRGSSYEGRVTYKKRTYTVHGDTVTEVKQGLTDLRYNLFHGIISERSNLTFDEWFAVWLEEYKRHRVKIGTLENYKSYYTSLVFPVFGSVPISEIRGTDVQHLYNVLADSGYSISAIRIVSVLVSGSLAQAERNGMIDRNPAKLALLPKSVPCSKRTALTRDQQNAFMLGAQKSYLANFFGIMLRTGLRNGELRGLRFSDVDFDENVIHIRRTLKYIDGRGYFEDSPKTLSSIRDIPLTKEITEMLVAQKCYWGFSAERPDRYLFCTKNGHPLSRDRVQGELDKIVTEINESGFSFERITPHVLRHTFATRAIEAGMSPQVLKSILGHSSLAMTMDLYGHVLPEYRSAEMERISSAF